MPRRWLLVAIFGPALILLGLAGSWVIADWKAQIDLDRARTEVLHGHYAEARPRLKSLSEGDGEAAYLLGLCEQATGHHEAAVSAWARVRSTSPFAAKAAVAATKTLVGDLGRYADAECILERALPEAKGPDEVELRHALSQLYFQEGRRDAMRRVVREGWRRSPQPSAELRDLWMIDNATTQLSVVTADVDEAGKKAPDDDRVWLAKANLATQAGRFADAARWLDRCQARRPDDPAVWRARLDLAQASNNVNDALSALPHVQADTLSPAEVESVHAWLAERRGDRAGQRAALERLILLDPGDTRALERLASIAWEDGRADEARTYRSRKSEVDRAKERLLRLLEHAAPSGGFADLARLSEATGRSFDALGWWTLAGRSHPEDPAPAEALARLRSEPTPAPQGVEKSVRKTLVSRFGIRSGDQSTISLAETSSTSLPRVAVPTFRDGADRSGLRFIFENGRSPLRQLPETTSGGVAILDYDGDGLFDVYCVQGGPFPPPPGPIANGDRLFRNQGKGVFGDVTRPSGIGAMPGGYGHGVAVGDVDNDGHPDLFITRWRSYALYRNRGNGTFEDVTSAYGLGGDRDWPTSAAFADLDGDGDLDLYVCHYLAWDADHPQLCPRGVRTADRPDPNRLYDYCMPNPFPALSDHLFRNDGGKFVDVTESSGIVDRNGRGLGVVAGDLDGDGRVDLFVANDTTANYLFHNLGGLKFEEIGAEAGVASNAEGAYQAGMGTALGDLDGDGLPDLLVTNFYGESTTFYRNLGGLSFSDQTASIGLAAASRFRLGFGVCLLDVNNDGRLDLATACGHVIDNRPDYPYAMKSQLLIGNESDGLTDVTDAAGPPWTIPSVARGLAVGDLDSDGRVDVLIVAEKDPIRYAQNQSRTGHFVSFLLEGTRSNRDAVGAWVRIDVAGGKQQWRWRTGGGSYQSASDPRLHFGLGAADRVKGVEVRWPSGQVDRFNDLPADHGYRLREGDSVARPIGAETGPGRDPS